MEDKDIITIEETFNDLVNPQMLDDIRSLLESYSKGTYVKIRFNDKEVIDWDDLKYLVEKDEKGGHE